MKKFIFILCFAFCIIYLNGQDFYMYVNGQKHFYETSASKILLQSDMLDTTDIKKSISGNSKNTICLRQKLTMIELADKNKETISILLKQFNANENITYASPVLLNDAGKAIGGITNQVLVRLKSTIDYPILLKTLKSYNIETIQPCKFDKFTYLISLGKNMKKGAMQVANALYETRLFEYAEPNLVHFIELSTNDQYFTQQWGLNNTGQSGGTSGADIKANQAWNITTGSSDVTIAILDVGVELNHPDLVNNLLSGFDATGNNSNGAPVNNTGDNAHGTACAGVVAARANNTIGIAGVAYNCRILPVRIATRSGGWTTTESQYIANGIDWAKTNNANVISMSFTCIETGAVNTAINQAVTLGRNNLGCILVASSGNDYLSSVAYPARLPNIIAVGAINRNGQRADFSNYGQLLDVVAPGVNIYTTDLQGSAGYNKSNGANGNYYANFGGTSAACPHVSGVAALILSVRPDLTQAQVRQAIESTCTKLPGYSFSNNSSHPNGTWNNQVGHGLLNAYAAVHSVIPTISGPSFVCFSSVGVYTAANAPAGFTWDQSSNINSPTISGNSATFTAKTGSANNGAGWIAIKSGSVELARQTVWVGAPLYSDMMNLTINQGCEGPGVYYAYIYNMPSNLHLSTTGFEWMTHGGWTMVEHPHTKHNPGPSMQGVRITAPNPEQITMLGIRMCNPCGCTEWEGVTALSPCSYYSIQAGPNPVGSSLTVSIEVDEAVYARQRPGSSSVLRAVEPVPMFELKLFSNSGFLVRQTSSAAGVVSIDVSTLPNGFYFLHVYGNDKTTPRVAKIVVKH